VQDVHPAIKWLSNHFIKKQYYKQKCLTRTMDFVMIIKS